MAKLDLSKFKKVSSDKDFTVMRHKDGHEIKIAHKPLSAETRSELDGIKPMADGGEAKKGGPYIDPQAAKEVSAGVQGKKAPKKSSVMTGETYPSPMGAEDAAEYGQNQTAEEHNKYADGGEVDDDSSKRKVGQIINYPGVEASPKPEQPKRQKMAAGGEPVSTTAQDTPDQIVADLPQAAAQPDAPQVDPELQAKRSVYNQLIQSKMGPSAFGEAKGADPSAVDATQAAQFGPNGEPPANFNVDAWQQAETNYKQSQDTELANKQQATQQLAAKNQALVAAGLPPIPITADMAASVKPTQSDTSNAPATQMPDPQAALPGDKELQRLQGQQSVGSGVSGGRGVASAPSPQDTAQKLVAAKQLTYDALMHERQQMLAQLTDINPKTMGTIFHDKDLPGKLGMIAGMMLGGGAAGVLGGPNKVAEMYQNVIDNDLKKQQLNLQSKQGLLANNLALMGNISDAVKLSKVQANDLMMHKLVQLAQKYPNNPQIQQQLQALGMMGAQSSSNLMDSLAANLAWRHSIDHIQDPAQKIQFSPVLNNEQKNEAMKQLQTYQNMNSMRSNFMEAFDKVGKMNLAGTFSPNAKNALLQPLLAQAVKDSEGRITPQDVPMIEALLPSGTDSNSSRAIKRVQLAKFMSAKMNFPMLKLAGVDVATPTIGITENRPTNIR